MRDDKILESRFWRSSLEERRCLVPATSFCEPNGDVKPASWHWFALRGRDERPIFAFPGIWRRYQWPVRKDGPKVELEVYTFLTPTPNELVAIINHERMPVLLTREEEFRGVAQRRTGRSTGPHSGVPAWADANCARGLQETRFARRRGVAITRRMAQTQGGSVALRRRQPLQKVLTSTWSALMLLSITSSPPQQLRPRTRSPCVAFQRTLSKL